MATFIIGNDVPTVTAVSGNIEVGQQILGLKVRRSRWAVWWERVRTLRWSVPMIEARDAVITRVSDAHCGDDA